MFYFSSQKTIVQPDLYESNMEEIKLKKKDVGPYPELNFSYGYYPLQVSY